MLPNIAHFIHVRVGDLRIVQPIDPLLRRQRRERFDEKVVRLFVPDKGLHCHSLRYYKPSGDEYWQLLARADVLVQNLAPGAAARLGLSYEELQARRPQYLWHLPMRQGGIHAGDASPMSMRGTDTPVGLLAGRLQLWTLHFATGGGERGRSVWSNFRH